MFMKGGQEVAAVGPIQNEGQPPVWVTYIATADADASAKAITGAGGTALAEPFDVMDVGRMGVFMDPTGGAFAIWQAKLHRGAGLVNEPGALCWNELHTADPSRNAVMRVSGSSGSTFMLPMVPSLRITIQSW